MEEIKVTVEISDIKLNIQCDPKWLAGQMAFLMENFPALFGKKEIKVEAGKAEPEVQTEPEKKPEPLPLIAFLKQKNAMFKQNRRFLGTAIWLMEKGKNRFEIKDITRTLKEFNITGIKSPAACRYQLCKRGVLRQNGKYFSVTEKGMKDL